MVVRARVRRASIRRRRCAALTNATTVESIDTMQAEPVLKGSETCTTLETSLSNSPSSDRVKKVTETDSIPANDVDEAFMDDASRAKYNSSVYSLLKSVPLINSLRRTSSRYRDKLAAKREKRALRTLLIITGVFITCWMPFFVFAILMPFCGEHCENMPKDVIHFVTWLGYFNSMLNPIIYTIFSPDFRNAFKKLLCWS